ncbi:MAG: right-handed parallel beta-helix repeat-containing protein [Armatimonadetes bacterium]|nr:right-handed parallel beta-helix repeat-containing protein [Armatimonadota bacterium]
MMKLNNGVLVWIAVVLLGAWICIAQANGVNDVRNVKDFGGVGDGVSDDTAAIQAAIDDLPDAGGVVSISAGTYIVSNLRLKSGTDLRGAGQATVLKARPDAATILRFADGPQDRIRISDLVLDGNKEEQSDSGYGLYLAPGSPTTNLAVERVRFRNHKYDAIVIAKSNYLPEQDHRNLLFRDIDIRTTDKNGIRIQSGSDIWIDRACIVNNDGHGIYTEYRSNVENLSVANSQIAGSGKHNIFLGDTSNARIENNYLYFSGRIDDTCSGIQANRAYAETMTGLTVVGNTIEASQGYGICTSGVDEFVMVGNRLKGGRDPGIRVGGGSKNWLISGNTITGVYSIGLVVVAEPADQSVNATISGNVFQGCCMSAIALSGGQNISVTGNTIMDNATWRLDADDPEATDWSGIQIGGAEHVLVTGNRTGNSPGNSTQGYGVVEEGAADFNSIYGNDLSNNAVAAYATVGANTKVWGNQGATP